MGSVSARKKRTRQEQPSSAAAMGATAKLERRALSHVGGRVELTGPGKSDYAAIEHALMVASEDTEIRAHVHGFHSYPARLHPATARRLIEAFSTPGDTVLDPFCGSGTVLVEATLLGRSALGFDINPLAAELSRLKTLRSLPEHRSEWLAAADRVVSDAEDRRALRAGPTRPYSAAERAPFAPHILLELDGIRHAIEREAPVTRPFLRLVLSSILTKVSNSPGDSRERVVARRLASGFAIRTFAQKAEEAALRIEDYNRRLGKKVHVKVRVGDARKLDRVEPASVGLVLCSPPYPGVFDYLSHHQIRLDWLGLSPRNLAEKEIGSRRQLSRLEPQAALTRFRADLLAALRSLHAALAPGRLALLVVADSALGDTPVFADTLVVELARRAGFSWVATGSQRRPHFHPASRRAFGSQPRREHLIALRKDPPDRATQPRDPRARRQ